MEEFIRSKQSNFPCPYNKFYKILDDFKTLHVTIKSKNEKTGECETEESEYPLEEVDVDTIKLYRQRSKTFIVIKKNDHFYITQIPKDLTLTGSTFCGMHHRCSFGKRYEGTCPRLLSIPEEEGGCAKVYDFKEAKIENYPWISFGVETVNTSTPCFMVLKCDHYPDL